MSNEELVMRNEKRKKKNCADCLYCKVSACSREQCWICFCEKSKKKPMYKENYWTERAVCKLFDDMSA
jgi:hypothetical protein